MPRKTKCGSRLDAYLKKTKKYIEGEGKAAMRSDMEEAIRIKCKTKNENNLYRL